MRLLVVGVGAVGGYFGGRLLAAGRDVTFLVRPARAARLKDTGLRIKSPHGDLHVLEPPVVTAADPGGPYDLILLACKAYDLEPAMQDIARAVGPDTVILPLLNGMRHLDTLDQRFGAGRVLGGQCVIASTLEADGTIVQLAPPQGITFGERDGGMSERIAAIEAQLQGAGFEARASATVLLDMWEKWVFLATLAGMTSLMRGSVGDIVAAGGADDMLSLLEAARATAEAAGYAPRAAFVERTRGMLTAAGSPMNASMLRDMSRGGAIEAEHVLGDLLRRHDALLGTPNALLRAVYLHAAIYEARRQRAA